MTTQIHDGWAAANGRHRAGAKAKQVAIPIGLVVTALGAAVGYGRLQQSVAINEQRIDRIERQLEKLDRIDKSVTRIETLLEERTSKK